ncbi:hypothetical protein [uncultured Campylobacter sp.]|uniref:hypothetical protein n=1 Tax=uncultured Campylobacter sp. TaxID=218934 RepID=UPI00262EBE16|nr:hypothetical protein [uncultured Campylobacter sp.]
MCAAYLCVVQASARPSSKCSYASSPPFFRTIAKENAALSAVFGIDTAHKFLLEMGATNRCRRGACFIGS